MKLNKKQFSQYLCFYENPNVIMLANMLLMKLLFQDKVLTAKDFYFVDPQQEGIIFIPGKITISKDRLVMHICSRTAKLSPKENLEVVFPFLKTLPDYPQTLELIILNEKNFAGEGQVKIAMQEAYNHGVTEKVLRNVIANGKDHPQEGNWWLPLALMETFIHRGKKLQSPEPLLDGEYLASIPYDKVFELEKLAIKNNIFCTVNPEKDYLSFSFAAFTENKVDEALDIFEQDARYPATGLKICTRLLEADNLSPATILRLLNWIDKTTAFCGPKCDEQFFEKLTMLKHGYPEKISKIAQQLAKNTPILHAPLCKFIADEYPQYLSELLGNNRKDAETFAQDLIIAYISVENKKEYMKFLKAVGLDKLLQKYKKENQDRKKFFQDFGIL